MRESKQVRLFVIVVLSLDTTQQKNLPIKFFALDIPAGEREIAILARNISNFLRASIFIINVRGGYLQFLLLSALFSIGRPINNGGWSRRGMVNK